MRAVRWAISATVLLLSPLAGAAPSVTLSAPAAGTRYVAPATIEVVADPVVDAGRTIARVEFLADGELVGTATAAPWSLTLANIARGNLNLRARVVDSAGRRESSAPVRVHVRNNTAPKVRLSAPEHRFVAPGSVPLTATVTDRDDPIARVEFFSGDTLLATLTAEPYAISWTDVPVGDYEVRATATDTLGAAGTSAPFRVRVRDNRAPRVRILGPENNTTYAAPATIPISLRAVDRDDNLTNVVVSANGTQLATLTAAPFDFSWTNVPAGTYVLTAQATDDFGLITISRTVNVTVTGAPPPTEPKLYFIHVDHLNTPRLIADEQKRVVWRWDQREPFGDNVPDEDPESLGLFEFPMRFPGQYFDIETNLLYNYYRDYDASTGRYVESDPIGLAAGVNTYAYVFGNPTRYVDSMGLEAQMCTRPFYPAPVPYARHCFLRFNGDNNDTIGYSSAGVGPDPAPTWWPKDCIPTKGQQNDDCLKREMKKCQGDQYDLFSPNCCNCVEQAMKRCGLWIPKRDWPNWPVNPGPQPGGR